MSMRWWMLLGIIVCAMGAAVRGDEKPADIKAADVKKVEEKPAMGGEATTAKPQAAGEIAKPEEAEEKPAEPVKPPEPPRFTNVDLPIDERVADLLSRLTIDEKISQMQETSPALPRFNIEGFQWWSEGVHGIGRAGRATVFPVAIAQAAAWDVELMRKIADATATEARAKYNAGERGRYRGLTIWAPSINLIRDPRWGRCQENWGEDPYFVSRLGVAFCEGLQGDDRKYLKTAATPKHFAVHSQETGRASTSFDVSMRLMREYYLPAFYACFTEAGAVSTMAAFSGINGVPDTANKWLLTDLLRKEWGFDGAVVTDWGAVTNLYRSFRYVPTDEQAAEAAMKAGVDVFSEPRGSVRMLRQAYDKGLITEKDLDQALTNSFKVRFRLGMFDPKERVKYAQIPYSAVGSPEHKELALQTSRESVVLLKNEPGTLGEGRPLLPLDRRRIESIAVLGPYAEKMEFGDYSGNPANPAVTPEQGIIDKMGGRIAVRTARWGNVEQAVNAAATSDVAVVMLGLNMRIEHEGHDRKDMDLPRDQQEFVEKIAAVNPNVVVVLVLGSPVTIDWIAEHVPAVMVLWYAGEQGGNALAEVLLGEYNPGGRLPTTWYKSLDQLPPINDYDITAGPGRTYMYLKTPPLYPFGYGLSYTTFAYSDLSLDKTMVTTDGKLTVKCKVTNTGGRDGDEVVQMYVRHVDSKLVQPIRQLKGFERRAIAAGKSETFAFELNMKDMANWDEAGSKWFVEPGEYEVQIGSSSADIHLRQRFTVR